MNTRLSHQELKNRSVERLSGAGRFDGFALPTSNTTYVPNQFFDVCLRNHSRSVIRIVGYMIRKTLGWCDEHGNPQHERISVSYNELEKKAGVGHSSIRAALEEAVAARFIKCTRPGVASSQVHAGWSSQYELEWDESGEYVKDSRLFRGFFAGDGNRTYIPNQFFDHLLPRESLTVIQVTGSIIRFSIGFVNKFGHRRQRVALSYRDIQRYAKIVSPNALAKALREASMKNYIQLVEEGFFDPNGGQFSRSAHYAIRWVSKISEPITPGAQNGDSTLILSHIPATTPKRIAAVFQSKNHSENHSGTTPKRIAANHSEKDSGIQIKQINKTNKVVEELGSGHSAVGSQREDGESRTAVSIEKLKEVGFDESAAKAIANRYPIERILRQIDWLDERPIRSNRLGMLRKAIEQDWARPTKLGQPNSPSAAQDRIGIRSIAETLAKVRETSSRYKSSIKN